jgi:fatty-acid peroxygenase
MPDVLVHPTAPAAPPPSPPDTTPDLEAHDRPFPRDPAIDSTRAFLSEGYRFISNRCRELGSDVFETRLMMKRVLCMQGEEAAQLFYGGGRFTRKGATPPTVLRLLQDKGSVQTLDGLAHRARKQMFMSLMSAENVARLTEEMEEAWRIAIPTWSRRERFVLHDEVREILCRAVTTWADVPLADKDEVSQRTRELGAMIDGAGSLGLLAARGLLLRRRTERWARRIIDDVRSGRMIVPEWRPLHAIATFRDDDGKLLDRKVAAVELINLLRPTVAVARFIVYAAVALHEHPRSRAALASGDDASLERFAQEVRRFYPFFPVVGGRAKRALEHRGQTIDQGTWVLFDLFGTNRDKRIWGDPDEFRPERFLERKASAFDLVAQGGGEHLRDHRCPGEDITVALVKRATHLLVTAMEYTVPPQHLWVDLARMPALPESGLVLTDIRAG